MDSQLDIHWSDKGGRTRLHYAVFYGKGDRVEKLLSLGADVNKPKNNGATPLLLAAQRGLQEVAALLLSNGADTNKPNNEGLTPVLMAIWKQNDEVESLLRAAGASIPTDEMDLETVEDVVSYIEKLGIRPKYIPRMKTSIRDKNINAEIFFAIQDAKAMLNALGVSNFHIGWGNVFYRLMKAHQSIQKDRAQSSGAARRAAEALKNMDNPCARSSLHALQCKIYNEYFNLVMPSLETYSDAENQSELRATAVNARLEETLQKIKDEAKKEESRLGNEVTEKCLDKYKALEERWAKVEHLPEISKEKERNRQPIANTAFGKNTTTCEASPFGSTNGNNPDLERLEHLVLMSRLLLSFFQRQMEKISERVNKAKNPQELGLSYEEFDLPFNNSFTVDGGKRASLTFGPIKKAERALKKAKEYEEEMNKGEKEKIPSPSDYVIDFLRCTFEVEDPYLVGVIFSMLLKEEIATCLQICRVKNKFVNDKLPKHIRTNVLMNLALLYPHNEEEFKDSGLTGEFDSLMAGKCLMVCELQITMKDFLLIKVRLVVFSYFEYVCFSKLQTIYEYTHILKSLALFLIVVKEAITFVL
mmetsp:Transcript_31901/g.42416  ORF Transcript_31901/g.42416 Transcript_31901/m.42416 type:complete len:588 (+) Transcript_31901:147-1910(+)